MSGGVKANSGANPGGNPRAGAGQTEVRRVLVVDDDPVVADSLAEFLRAEGHLACSAYTAGEASAMLVAARDGTGAAGAKGKGPYHAVLCDVGLPDRDGLSVLREVTAEHPATVVVMLTGYGTVESAVETLRAGAVDYLMKPIVDRDLRLALERAFRQQALVAENQRLKRSLDKHSGFDSIVGGDPRMKQVYELVSAVAPSRTTVLMSGESGTGKSLIAHAIHRHSPRKDKPFVELSCGSIPESLLESELFGHVKGAFTGAHADKVGRFVAADGGTIFLDEINSASPAMQLKLLRVLQERKLEPVGSTETIEVDVRVVLAANESLEKLVEQGRFRQDLYYRINVMKIELPPLRERVGDIPLLAGRFLEAQSAELGRQIVGFDEDAMSALRRYPFPGNVRELANIVERAAVLCRGQTITAADLPASVLGDAPAPLRVRAAEERTDEWEPMPLADALELEERRVIALALASHDWNRQATADALGINRTTLYKKIKAYHIEPERAAG